MSELLDAYQAFSITITYTAPRSHLHHASHVRPAWRVHPSIRIFAETEFILGKKAIRRRHGRGSL